MRTFGVALALLTVAAPFTIIPARAEPATHGEAAPHTDAGPAHAAAPAKIRQAFDIIRKGDKIGANMVDIDHKGDTTTVRNKTDISVKVMYIEMYRYDHACSETWKNGQLIAFKSQTNDNGTKHAVEMAQSPTLDKITLIVDGKKTEEPKSLAPASLWSKDLVTRTELFDPADGKRFTVKVTDVGPETLTIHGVQHPTHHYQITAKPPADFDRDLWFEGDLLVRMKMVGSDKSTIVSDLVK
jgi:hypothetical protein